MTGSDPFEDWPMATPKLTRTVIETGQATFGLVANGSCARWTVELDESSSDPERLYLGIEAPSASFLFEISAPTIVDRMLQLLRPGRVTQSDSNPVVDRLVVGKDKKNSVCLIRDDEFDDRYFLAFGPADTPVVRYTVAGSDLNCLVTALEQVREDLQAR